MRFYRSLPSIFALLLLSSFSVAAAHEVGEQSLSPRLKHQEVSDLPQSDLAFNFGLVYLVQGTGFVNGGVL